MAKAAPKGSKKPSRKELEERARTKAKDKV